MENAANHNNDLNQRFAELKAENEALRQDLAELRQQKEKFISVETLLDIAELGGWQWNDDFSEVFFTNELKKIFGFSDDSKFSMQEALQLVHPDDVPMLSKILQKVIETKGDYNAQYRIFRIGDKVLRYIWAKGKFVNGRLTGVAMDITERKELELTSQKLALRNDELDSFVYTASHDLRSPINNMEKLVEYLSKEIQLDKENTKGQLYIKMLGQSMSDLRNTLDDLTKVTEIHPGEKKELVDLKTVIEEVQISLFNQIEEAEAMFSVDLHAPFLTIPKKHVRSLLYNLLSNSLKFRSKERKPIITISSFLSNDKIHLTFSDNGIGIRAEDHSKIFVIFNRFNKEIAGRGVGMYLVKRVVDLNDGDIRMESKENEGTTFYIQFPTDYVTGLI
jgi:signal transduction histidine kinase